MHVSYSQSLYPHGHVRCEPWQIMVVEFTARTITFGIDRLPTISALARLMQANPEDEYICGLWRRNIIRNLTWISRWNSRH